MNHETLDIVKTMTARINGCPIVVNIVNDYDKCECDVFVSIPDPSFDNPGNKLFTYHESNMHWAHALEYDIQKSIPEAKEEEIKEFVKEVYNLYEYQEVKWSYVIVPYFSKMDNKDFAKTFEFMTKNNLKYTATKEDSDYIFFMDYPTTYETMAKVFEKLDDLENDPGTEIDRIRYKYI